MNVKTLCAMLSAPLSLVPPFARAVSRVESSLFADRVTSRSGSAVSLDVEDCASKPVLWMIEPSIRERIKVDCTPGFVARRASLSRVEAGLYRY